MLKMLNKKRGSEEKKESKLKLMQSAALLAQSLTVAARKPLASLRKTNLEFLN